MARVQSPDGTRWTVKRQLVRRPRWRGLARLETLHGGAAFDSADSLLDLVFGIVALLLLALAIVLVWPLVVLLAQLAVAAVLLVWRFVFGRWTVVAETPGERRTWRVRGRQPSADLAGAVAQAIRAGATLPGTPSFETTVPQPRAVENLGKPERTGHVRVLRR